MRTKREYTDEPIEVACRDLCTGLTGRLVVQDEDLRLTLFSFNGQLASEHEEQYVLQLENSEYATILKCIPGGGVEGTYGRSDFVCRQFHIVPNVVVIGGRAWTSDDVIRSMRFKFFGAKTALHYSEHSRHRFEASSEETGGAVDTHTIDYSRVDILNAQGNGIQIRLWMSVAGSLGIERETQTEPVVIVGIEEGAQIDAFLSIVHGILAFFEISLGVRSRIREIYISSKSEQEQIASMDSGGKYEEFRLRLCFGDWAPSMQRTHPADVVFPVYSSDDRDVAKAALSLWLERRQAWKQAYALASAYLSAPDLYGRDRLLRPFAWFEAIPPYQEKSGISGSQIKKLAGVASQKAQELSIPVDKARLGEVLGELKRAPLSKRMRCAVNRVRARFGDSVIPRETDQDCREAVRLRNLAAHGSLDAENVRPRSFMRAIEAVQMVCFLSMLLDLDLVHAPGPSHPLMLYKMPWG